MPKTKGRRLKVLLSFEWPRRLLSKKRAGILVKDETFTITKEGQFTASKLQDLVARKYIKQLPKKNRNKKGRK